jgi:hypothetical protein
MEHCIGGDLLKILNDKNVLPNVKQILYNLLKGTFAFEFKESNIYTLSTFFIEI